MATFRLRGSCCQLIQHFNNLPDLNLTTPLINLPKKVKIISDEIELSAIKTFSIRSTRYCRECHSKTTHYSIGNNKYCFDCDSKFSKGIVGVF